MDMRRRSFLGLMASAAVAPLVAKFAPPVQDPMTASIVNDPVNDFRFVRYLGVGPTPPMSPAPGDVWLDSVTTRTWRYLQRSSDGGLTWMQVTDPEPDPTPSIAMFGDSMHFDMELALNEGLGRA